MTIGELVDDVQVALGEVHDDALLPEGLIMYYVGLATNKLAAQIATKQIRRNDFKGLMGFVSTMVVPTQLDTTLTRRYIDTPPVLDLPNGRGIDFIAYYRNDLLENCPPQVARVQFNATSWRELPLLYSDPITKPSAQRPYFIDGPERISLFGMQPQVTSVEVGLITTFAADDPEADIPLPPDALFDLRRMVLMAANWSLLAPNERRLNDGADFPVGMQKPQPPPPMSVNDPLVTTQPE